MIPTLKTQEEQANELLTLLTSLMVPEDLAGISIGEVFQWGLNEELISKYEYLIAKRHLPWNARRD